MVVLCKVDDVLKRFSLPSGAQDLEDTITSAFSAVTLFLQEYLATALDEGSFTDHFLVETYKWTDSPPGGLVRLFLNRAFLKQSPAVVLKASSDYDTMVAGNGEVVPATDYRVDYERGIVYLKGTYDQQHVSVAYSSGFKDEDPDDEAIPAWLKEAAISYVPVVLDQNSTNRTAESTNLTKSAGDHAFSVMTPHLRKAIPFPLKALY